MEALVGDGWGQAALEAWGLSVTWLLAYMNVPSEFQDRPRMAGRIARRRDGVPSLHSVTTLCEGCGTLT